MKEMMDNCPVCGEDIRSITGWYRGEPEHYSQPTLETLNRHLSFHKLQDIAAKRESGVKEV